MTISATEIAAKNGFSPENFNKFLLDHPIYRYDNVTDTLPDEQVAEAIAAYRQRIDEINKQKLEFFKLSYPETDQKKQNTTNSNVSNNMTTIQNKAANVSDENLLKQIKNISSLLTDVKNQVEAIRKYTQFFHVLTIISLSISVLTGIILALR